MRNIETEWMILCMAGNALRYSIRLANERAGTPFWFKKDRQEASWTHAYLISGPFKGEILSQVLSYNIFSTVFKHKGVVATAPFSFKTKNGQVPLPYLLKGYVIST